MRTSIVLLENQGVLPLARDARSIAVVGPLAEARAQLLGTWCLDGREADVVSVIDGVRSIVSPETRIIGDAVSFEAALALTPEADLVVAVIGEHPTRSGEAASVTDIDLPPGQLEFISRLAVYGKPLVVVVISGRPLALEQLRFFADALLLVFHPGIDGGRAIAEILFGLESPSGKLPATIPRTTGQIPIYYSRRSSGRPPKDQARYTAKHIDVPFTPSYSFGYGLSVCAFRVCRSANRSPADYPARQAANQCPDQQHQPLLRSRSGAALFTR